MYRLLPVAVPPCSDRAGRRRACRHRTRHCRHDAVLPPAADKDHHDALALPSLPHLLPFLSLRSRDLAVVEFAAAVE